VKVGAADGSVSVDSESRFFQEPEATAREALWFATDRAGVEPHPRSDAAHLIDADARGDEASLAVAHAPVVTLSLPVEEVATEFIAVMTRDAWAAVAEVEGVRITVVARGVEPDAIRLGRVDDPSQLRPRLA
jgi:hypothetical protein